MEERSGNWRLIREVAEVAGSGPVENVRDEDDVANAKPGQDSIGIVIVVRFSTSCHGDPMACKAETNTVWMCEGWLAREANRRTAIDATLPGSTSVSATWSPNRRDNQAGRSLSVE